MSCGTCPDSAQPTTRQDGTAPTPGSLLWSADVGAWYRRQRARGERPAVATPAPSAPSAPRPPAPVERSAPFVLPRTAQEAAAFIDQGITELTGQPLHLVAARPGDQVTIIAGTTRAQKAALADVGLAQQYSLMLNRQEWQHFAARLQVLRVASRVLPGFLVEAMDSRPLATADELALYAQDGLIVLAARNDHRLRYLRGDPRTLAMGVGYEDGLEPADASKMLQRWRAGQAEARYCPLCGAQIDLEAKTCAECVSGASMV